MIKKANPDDVALACMEVMKAMVMMSLPPPEQLAGPPTRNPLRPKTNWSAALRAATHLPGTPLVRVEMS